MIVTGILIEYVTGESKPTWNLTLDEHWEVDQVLWHHACSPYSEFRQDFDLNQVRPIGLKYWEAAHGLAGHSWCLKTISRQMLKTLNFGLMYGARKQMVNGVNVREVLPW